MSSNSSEEFYDALQEPLDPPKVPLKYTPLHIAAKNGRIRRVEHLLMYSNIGVNNADNYFGMTPLHWAALNGHLNVVNLLIKQPGINMTIKDKNGNTAVDLANMSRHFQVVNAIESEVQANIDYKSSKRFATPNTHRDYKVGGRRKSRRATKSKRKRRTKRRRR